ncbi:hypothetical protein HY745_09995 [Candidatus Desantisbacteria bacterium]|nr:hypothetical protein [Candidatus Desantisbacteria bacterium]
MSIFCGNDSKSICDQFNFKIKETETGLIVEISPKDAGKAESLKALAKACKDFCGCC